MAVHDLNKSGARFIVLASDGVTNMIRPNDCVQMVANFEARKERGVSTYIGIKTMGVCIKMNNVQLMYVPGGNI